MSILLKHIRIPEDVCREIDKAAEKSNTDFLKRLFTGLSTTNVRLLPVSRQRFRT